MKTEECVRGKKWDLSFVCFLFFSDVVGGLWWWWWWCWWWWLVALAAVIVANSTHGYFEVGGALLLDLVGERVDFESVEARHELVGGLLGPVLGVHHEQHVREAGAEVGAVRVVVA